MMTIAHDTPDLSKIPGAWLPKTDLILSSSTPDIKRLFKDESAMVLIDAFSDDECDSLVKLFMESNIAEPVSIQGRKDIPDDRVGSVRATAWSEHLAKEMWKKFENVLKVKITTPFTKTDWWQNSVWNTWKPVEVSPLLRFMRYENHGQHYAHYDAGYIYPDQVHRTLMSFVLYLTTNTEGGATRFIKDGQDALPIHSRNHDDWTRESHDNEVIKSIYPKKGNVLLFDHRLCHDVEAYRGKEPRIIIRGDITYEAIQN